MKTVIIRNVRGVFAHERCTLDIVARVNRYGGATLYQQGCPDHPLHCSFTLETKLERLARKAVRHGQSLVDWSAR